MPWVRFKNCAPETRLWSWKGALLRYTSISPLMSSLAWYEKFTWALADIGTPHARDALTRISNCDNPIIASCAKQRLDNLEKERDRKLM